jgi:hypothetical protein
MKPIENFKITYYEKGKEKQKEFVIKFASNRVRNDFNELMNDSNKVKNSWDEAQEILTDNAVLKLEKPEGWKKKTEENKEKYEEIVKSINAFGDNDFFKRRFKIIKKLLIQNGHEDQEDFMSFDFWNEKVDPDELVRQLSKVIYKDIIEYAKKKSPN